MMVQIYTSSTIAQAHLRVLHVAVDALEAVQQHLIRAALWQSAHEHLARFDFRLSLLLVLVNTLDFDLAAVDHDVRGLRQLDNLEKLEISRSII